LKKEDMPFVRKGEVTSDFEEKSKRKETEIKYFKYLNRRVNLRFQRIEKENE